MGSGSSKKAPPRAAADKLAADPDFAGPDLERRRSTDCFFCLLIMAHWLALTAVAALAFEKGNPNLLLHGMDYKGYVCGQKGNPNAGTQFPYLCGGFARARAAAARARDDALRR